MSVLTESQTLELAGLDIRNAAGKLIDSRERLQRERTPDWRICAGLVVDIRERTNRSRGAKSQKRLVSTGPALASGTSSLSDTLPFVPIALAANCVYAWLVTTRLPSVAGRAGVAACSAFQCSRSRLSVSWPAASRISSPASSSV